MTGASEKGVPGSGVKASFAIAASCLGEDVGDDLAVDDRRPLGAAGALIDRLEMVEAQKL
jgi:hypothetical protein